MNLTKPQALTASAILVLAVGSAGYLYYFQSQSLGHAVSCDAKSLRTMSYDSFRGSVERANLAGAADACESGRTKAEAEGQGDSTVTPTTSATSPTPPSPTPGAACETRYLANEPLSSLVWENSFRGNALAIKPGLAGRPMESLNVEEALQESEYTRSVDPMLTYAEAAQFNVLPQLDEKGQQAKISELATNCAERTRINAETTRVKREDYNHEVVTLPAGHYVATFTFGGSTPIVVTDYDVNRTEGFRTLKLTRKSDGHVEDQRLACGFQEYETAPAPVKEQAPQMPAVPQGMARTPEGVPYVPEVPPSGGETPSSTPPETTTTGTPPPTTVPPTTTTVPPTTTQPPTTVPPTTTVPPATCPAETPNGSPETGCKDGASNGPAPYVPPQQQPNPLPASPEMEQPEQPAPPAVVYTPPPVAQIPSGPPVGSTPDPEPQSPPPAEVGNGSDGSAGTPGEF